MKAKLGDRIRDGVTGIEGIVIEQNRRLGGGCQSLVQPESPEVSSTWIENGRLHVLARNAASQQPTKTSIGFKP